MELRLVKYLWTAIGQLVHANRTTGYGASGTRFRRDNVLKLAIDLARETSPFGEVAKAIEEVENLPEDEKAQVMELAMDKAREAATEFNETAPQPIGKRPMRTFATYELDRSAETHLEQSSSLNDTAAPIIQFAFYKPPSSSSPSTPTTNPESSSGAVGPIRKKRQRRKNNQLGRNPRRGAERPAEGAGPVAEKNGSPAVDTSTMADANLVFSSSLYDIHENSSSSASGQGLSTFVPAGVSSQPSGLDLPYPAQDNYIPHFEPSWEDPGTTLFNAPPQPAPAYEDSFWHSQQQMSGKINAMGLGDPFGGAGLFGESCSLYGCAVGGSDCTSVYHTPASAFNQHLELIVDSALPQFSHSTDAIHDALGLGSVLNDGTGTGFQADLAPLSGMPPMDLGNPGFGELWDTAFPAVYQDIVSTPSINGVFAQPPSDGSTFAKNRQSHAHGQDLLHPVQRSAPSFNQGDLVDRRGFAQWCEDECAPQGSRLPDRVFRHRQILHNIEQHIDLRRRGGAYQQPNVAPPYGYPPLVSGMENGDGNAIVVGGQAWGEGSYDTWNVPYNTISTFSNVASQNPHLHFTPYLDQGLNGFTHQGPSPGAYTIDAPSQHEHPGASNVFASDHRTPPTDPRHGTLVYGRN